MAKIVKTEQWLRLNAPWFDGQEVQEITRVLGTGWTSRGPECARFEAIVSDYLEDPREGPEGRLHTVSVTNCTAAIYLALKALDIGRGDEVILPDYTFPATALAVLHAGARPVFVDVLPDTYCIDAARITQAITKRTRAIIPVHLFGHPADMDAILEAALRRDKSIYIIEDAACALGAEYKGRKIGNHGDVICFSLHGRKVITTGEGGLCTTADPETADRIRSLSQFGMEATAYDRSQGEFQVPVFGTADGFNFKMSDIQAAIGVAQMRKIEDLIKHRTNMAAAWTRGFSMGPNIKVPRAIGPVRHTWQNYAFVINDAQKDVIEALREDGVEATIGTYSCLEQPAFEAYARHDCEVSRHLFYHSVSMPMPWGITIATEEGRRNGISK